MLNQIFKADGKNKILVGDITYIPTKKKRLYPAVFIDVFSGKVVGWAMDNKMKDDSVIAAFNQAYGKEHPAPRTNRTHRSGNPIYKQKLPLAAERQESYS